MIIALLVLVLEVVSIIIIVGILAHFIDVIDIFIKKIVGTIYDFGKSIGESIENIIKKEKRDE
jgi:hypothetical protein